MGGSSLARIVLPILVLGCLISPSGSWIALSKDGYTIKQNLLTEAGLKVEGTMAVNGVLISKPVDYLQCTPERKGAMRWNDKSFEGCDGETDWRPIEMCDRSCNIDTAAVPCGIEVRNKCGDACVKTGTGLNMRQCLLRVISTPCNEQVTDLCSNLCGVQGTFGCASSSERFGSVLIRAAEGTPNATAAFHLSVGQAGAPGQQDEKALFVTYKDRGGVQQDLTVLRRFDEGGEGGASGVDFSPPAGQDAATFRVSMLTEATGPYILVGDDRPEKPSHIFVDGLVDKECPFLFNAGSNDGNYTKICLENPTGMRTLQMPGVGGGSVITSGNREDIGTLGGLEGDNVLIYTGDYRDMSGSGNHTVPMQSRFHCEEDMLATCTVNQTGTCFHTDPSDPAFDLHRVYYVAGGEELPPLTTASVEVLGLLEASRAAGASQLELAQLYMRLVSAEAGLDVQGGEVDAGLEAMLAMNVLGPVTYAERCFVCCCSANNTRDGICPESRERVRPRFCVGGDMDGERCLRDDDCGYEYDGIVNRTYKCLDDASISCFDTDWGWQCFKAHETANFTTAVNFSNPTMHHSRLEIPDASGTVISTGNLQDITFMGVLDRPIVGKSTNFTTTKLVFDPSDLDSPSFIRQQLDAEESVGNSTLLVPSGADGILITTGNLEHVTLDSGMATGVRVSGDVQIDGWIEFGEDEGSSGVRAPPREGSTEYTQPAGGQQPGNAGGGQVPVRGPRGMTVLEVEASAGGSAQVKCVNHSHR